MKSIHRASGVALFIMLATVVGCRREAPPPVPPPIVKPAPPGPAVTPPPVVSFPAVAPSPQPAAPAEPIQDRLPTAPEDSALRNPVHPQLTEAVHLYLMDHRKMPSDFATLVKDKYVKSMPQAPAGKRYALDRRRLQVVLIDAP